MAKRIWMPLYIADYLSDTAHLTTLQHGAYMLLIMHYWVKGSLPENEDAIRRITRMDNRQWAANRDDLSYLFSTGWRHKRIDAELGKAIEKSKVNSANAGKRHESRNAPAERTHTQSQSQLESQLEERKNPAPSGAVPRKKKTRTAINPEASISQSQKDHALERGIHISRIDTIFEKFKNYHSSKGNLMANWDAAWRTWVGNEVERFSAPATQQKSMVYGDDWG